MALMDTYRAGTRLPIRLPVDSSTATIEVGSLVSRATAGYHKAAAAGDVPIGVAMERVTAPASDGSADVLVDISTQSIYEFAPDAGSVTQALVGATADVGGARTVDIDASTDDCLLIVGADLVANTVLVQLLRAGLPGVV